MLTHFIQRLWSRGPSVEWFNNSPMILISQLPIIFWLWYGGHPGGPISVKGHPDQPSVSIMCFWPVVLLLTQRDVVPVLNHWEELEAYWPHCDTISWDSSGTVDSKSFSVLLTFDVAPTLWRHPTCFTTQGGGCLIIGSNRGCTGCWCVCFWTVHFFLSDMTLSDHDFNRQHQQVSGNVYVRLSWHEVYH